MNLGSVISKTKHECPDGGSLLMVASVGKWGAVPPLRQPRRGTPIDYGAPRGDGGYDQDDGFDEDEDDSGARENIARHRGVARR